MKWQYFSISFSRIDFNLEKKEILPIKKMYNNINNNNNNNNNNNKKKRKENNTPCSECKSIFPALKNNYLEYVETQKISIEVL